MEDHSESGAAPEKNAVNTLINMWGDIKSMIYGFSLILIPVVLIGASFYVHDNNWGMYGSGFFGMFGAFIASFATGTGNFPYLVAFGVVVQFLFFSNLILMLNGKETHHSFVVGSILFIVWAVVAFLCLSAVNSYPDLIKVGAFAKALIYWLMVSPIIVLGVLALAALVLSI